MKITLLSTIAFASIAVSSSAAINSYYGPHLRKLQLQDCLQDGISCDQNCTQQQLQQNKGQQGQGDCLHDGIDCEQGQGDCLQEGINCEANQGSKNKGDCVQDGISCNKNCTQQQLRQGQGQGQQGQGACLQDGVNCDEEGLEEGDGSQGNVLQRWWRFEKLAFQHMFGKNAENVPAGNNSSNNNGNLRRRTQQGQGNCTGQNGDCGEEGEGLFQKMKNMFRRHSSEGRQCDDGGGCEGPSGDDRKVECDQDGDCDSKGSNSPEDCDGDGNCKGPYGDGSNGDCDQDGDCDGTGPNGSNGD